MDLLAELWAFLKVRKKLWLIPILVVMALFAALLFLGQSSTLAPFVYTIF